MLDIPFNISLHSILLLTLRKPSVAWWWAFLLLAPAESLYVRVCIWECGWSVYTRPPGDEKSKRKRSKEARNLGTDGKSQRNGCLFCWLLRTHAVKPPVHPRMHLTRKSASARFIPKGREVSPLVADRAFNRR